MKYALCGFSELEIPGEKNLLIYITNCQNYCPGCHTPYMHDDFGDYVRDYFMTMYEAYKSQITCVCFMGEGKNTNDDHVELQKYCDIVHKDKLKTAIYSGRDCKIEEWMKCFDYIKIGSYKAECGPLTDKNTNQRLYKKLGNKYEDITFMFWE